MIMMIIIIIITQNIKLHIKYHSGRERSPEGTWENGNSIVFDDATSEFILSNP